MVSLDEQRFIDIVEIVLGPKQNGSYVQAGFARLWQPLLRLSFYAGELKTAGETVQEVAC